MDKFYYPQQKINTKNVIFSSNAPSRATHSQRNIRGSALSTPLHHWTKAPHKPGSVAANEGFIAPDVAGIKLLRVLVIFKAERERS